jgi:hypothetical protein
VRRTGNGGIAIGTGSSHGSWSILAPARGAAGAVIPTTRTGTRPGTGTVSVRATAPTTPVVEQVTAISARAALLGHEACRDGREFARRALHLDQAGHFVLLPRRENGEDGDAVDIRFNFDPQHRADLAAGRHQVGPDNSPRLAGACGAPRVTAVRARAG